MRHINDMNFQSKEVNVSGNPHVLVGSSLSWGSNGPVLPTVDSQSTP
jgi:hypothetical protein